MVGVTDYQVLEIGGLDDWRSHYGGFRPESSRDGRRVVDHELTMQFIGLTANALEPGEEAGYWHRHARVEELYVFLEGRGQMGWDDDVIRRAAGNRDPCRPGRLAQWRCAPDSDGQLRWLCIRAGGYELPEFRMTPSARSIDRCRGDRLAGILTGQPRGRCGRRSRSTSVTPIMRIMSDPVIPAARWTPLLHRPPGSGRDAADRQSASVSGIVTSDAAGWKSPARRTRLRMTTQPSSGDSA